MTWGQWLFEYAALKKKEEKEAELVTTVMEASAHTMREILIGVLGLNLVHKDQFEAERRAAGEEVQRGTPYVPMSMLVGRPEIMKELIDELDKHEGGMAAMDDDEFDKFSRELQKRLESGDYGDMEPIIGPDETTPEKRWNTERMQALLRSAGVFVREEEDPDPVPLQPEAPVSSDLADIIEEVAPGVLRAPASSGERTHFGVVFDEE